MLLCFVNAGFGWNVSVVGGATDCASGFVAQSSADFVSSGDSGSSASFDISALSTLFNAHFQFDAVLAGEIIGWYLLAFVMGHGLGRMMRTWQKGM
jgi:hypothetical protein